MIQAHSQTDIYKPSLIGYWMLDESSGNALDSSGNGYDMTVSGATQGATGAKINSCYDFDGANDYCQTTAAGIISTFAGASNFTLSLWASAAAYNATSATFGMGLENDNDNFAFYCYSDGGKAGDVIEVWYDGAYIFQVSSALAADGTMNHFCFVQRSTTDHELYVNGVSVATDSTNKSLAAAMDHVTIGAYDSVNEFFDGKVDQVRLYDTDLTDDEITDLASMVTV